MGRMLIAAGFTKTRGTHAQQKLQPCMGLNKIFKNVKISAYQW